MATRKVERRTATMSYGDNMEKKTKVGLIAIEENLYTPNSYYFDYEEGVDIPIKRNDGIFDPLGYGDKPWFILPKGLVEKVIVFDDEISDDNDFDKKYNEYLDKSFNSDDRGEAKYLCDKLISQMGEEAFADQYFN